MRRFYLRRDVDDSGVSGTGRVAEGVLLNNGWVITEWNSHYKEANISESIAVFEKLHGHDGNSHIVWIDPDPFEEKRKKDESSEQPANGEVEDRGSGEVRPQMEEVPEQGHQERESTTPDEAEEA